MGDLKMNKEGSSSQPCNENLESAAKNCTKALGFKFDLNDFYAFLGKNAKKKETNNSQDYDFKEFEGKDKYERFRALRRKIHQDAINEYFEELYAKARANGKNKIHISFDKGIILKDGTRLKVEEIQEYVRKRGEVIYPSN